MENDIIAMIINNQQDTNDNFRRSTENWNAFTTTFIKATSINISCSHFNYQIALV